MSADRWMMTIVQRVIGTPWFLALWVSICLAWFATGGLGLDPEPFFLLNIFMSVWATLTLPVLTMASRWISEQQDAQIRQQSAQLAALVEMGDGLRDVISIMREQLQDIDADVDAIREARELESGE